MAWAMAGLVEELGSASHVASLDETAPSVACFRTIVFRLCVFSHGSPQPRRVPCPRLRRKRPVGRLPRLREAALTPSRIRLATLLWQQLRALLRNPEAGRQTHPRAHGSEVGLKRRHTASAAAHGASGTSRAPSAHAAASLMAWSSIVRSAASTSEAGSSVAAAVDEELARTSGT